MLRLSTVAAPVSTTPQNTKPKRFAIRQPCPPAPHPAHHPCAAPAVSLEASFKTKAVLSSVSKVTVDGPSPAVVARMLAEDKNNTAHTKVLRIGLEVPVAASLADFTQDSVPDGSIYRMAFTSPDALGMGINFAAYAMPDGASMFIMSEQPTVANDVRGSFTWENEKHYGGLSVMPVSGDTVVVEVHVPTGTALPTVVLQSVTHHYKPTMFPHLKGPECFGCSGDCNLNVACTLGDNFGNEIDGVTRLLTAGGGTLCSGSLINNVEADGRQLYLSADHCGGGNADGWILMFNFQSTTCENDEIPARDQTVSGTRLLARRGASDFVLLEVAEVIPAEYNAYMNGFDAAVGDMFDEPLTISHPSGDMKKIGIFGGNAIPSGYFNAGDTHWFVGAWDEGMTEGGSSGSPVFDDKRHIRGQLHGGFASCAFPYTDYYGRTAISWDQGEGDEQNLAPWLDPQGTGERIVDGMSLADARANAASKK